MGGGRKVEGVLTVCFYVTNDKRNSWLTQNLIQNTFTTHSWCHWAWAFWPMCPLGKCGLRHRASGKHEGELFVSYFVHNGKSFIHVSNLFWQYEASLLGRLWGETRNQICDMGPLSRYEDIRQIELSECELIYTSALIYYTHLHRFSTDLLIAEHYHWGVSIRIPSNCPQNSKRGHDECSRRETFQSPID